MCNGTIMDKLISFSIPLMLSGILQLMFNAVDIVVVGRFSGSQALAAVGSTTALINVFTNLFIGISLGANVLAARYYAAGKTKEMSETVHTAIALALVSGVAMAVIGVVFARGALEIMGTPDDVIAKSTLYMRIYFCGMPFFMMYNYGAAILRAVGDTRRPLYFLFAAGAVNVVLNLFFVIQLGMGVDGVAWATVISECVSAGLIIRSLMKENGAMKLHLTKLRIVSGKLTQIVRVGLPAGMQGAIFSISNVLIQSSVNSFGSIAMAGNTASSNIEGFVYTAMNAVYQTSLSFTSQNLGGEKFSRIDKIKNICLGVVTVVGLVLGWGAVLGGHQLLGIYSSDPEVLSFGMRRLRIICGTYFLCGLMDCMVGSLRGMGYSVIPMFVSLTGACAFRVFWIFTIFAVNRTLEVLYLSYPVSWIITAASHMVTYYIVRKHFPKEDKA